MTLELDTQSDLAYARELIRAHKYTQARNILEGLEENPTARRWLAKLDEKELFDESDDPKPKPKRVSDTGLIQDTLMLFTQNNWELKVQMSETVQVEKRRGPNAIASFLVIMLFSLIGMGLVLLGVATAKREVVTLRANGDGSLNVMWRNQNIRITNAYEAMSTVNAVKGGISYAGALTTGFIAFICYLVLFSM